MKCERCLGDKENTVGGVCFDCFHDMDDKEISRLYKIMTLKMFSDAIVEKERKCSKCGDVYGMGEDGLCLGCRMKSGKPLMPPPPPPEWQMSQMMNNNFVKPKPKVEFFESTNTDVLKEQLEEFLSRVDRIISINHTVFEWRYHVMVVYT
jgi:hypothetical protein